MSDESIYWLRKTSNLRVIAGNRRVYIRRSSQGGRPIKGEGICEDTPFRQFLRDYRFKIVDFGGGEQTVQEQLRLPRMAPHSRIWFTLIRH